MDSNVKKMISGYKDYDKESFDWDAKRRQVYNEQNKLNSQFNYFDVVYTSPSGAIGTCHSLKARSLADAVTKTPVMLAVNTPYHENEFTVLEAYLTPLAEQPKQKNLKEKLWHF